MSEQRWNARAILVLRERGYVVLTAEEARLCATGITATHEREDCPYCKKALALLTREQP